MLPPTNSQYDPNIKILYLFDDDARRSLSDLMNDVLSEQKVEYLCVNQVMNEKKARAFKKKSRFVSICSFFLSHKKLVKSQEKTEIKPNLSQCRFFAAAHFSLVFLFKSLHDPDLEGFQRLWNNHVDLIILCLFTAKKKKEEDTEQAVDKEG